MDKFNVKHTFSNIRGISELSKVESPERSFINVNWSINVRKSIDYLYISLKFSKVYNTFYGHINNFIYLTDIEINLLGNSKPFTRKDNYHISYGSGCYENKFILLKNLFDKMNGYVINNCITVEVNFKAKVVSLEEASLKDLACDLNKRECYSLDIEKHYETVIAELEEGHFSKEEKFNKEKYEIQMRQNSLEKIVDELKVIIDLLAQSKEETKTEESHNFNEKYELVKKEIEKLEQNEKDETKLQDISKRVAIYLAKLKVKNEDLEDELKLVESSKARLEKRVKTLRDELEKIIEIKDDEAEKERQENIAELRSVESNLHTERKEHAEAKIDNKNLDYKLQDLVREVETVKIDLKNKEKQLKDIQAKLDKEKKQHAETMIEKKKVESNLRDLNNVKKDLDQERKQHIETKEAMNKLESNVKEMKRTLENEKSFKKLYQNLKEKIAEDNDLKIEINDLEDKLEISAKEKLEQKISIRKLKNEVKKLTIFLEDKKQQIEENHKEIKTLKVELDKAKEEINKEKGEKLKTLREYEDRSETLELLKQENAALKNIKLRKAVKSTTSSFCEINEEEDSISIISENEVEDQFNSF